MRTTLGSITIPQAFKNRQYDNVHKWYDGILVRNKLSMIHLGEQISKHLKVIRYVSMINWGLWSIVWVQFIIILILIRK